MVLAATAVAAGLAFYMGWSYERGYVEKWGLPFSAFSYTPYDLMVVSSTTLLFAVATSAGVAFGFFGRPLIDAGFDYVGFPREDPWDATPWPSRVVAVTLGGIVVYTLIDAYIREDWGIALLIMWMILMFVAMFAWELYRAGSAIGTLFLLTVGITAFFFIVVFAPPRLGEDDARRDQEDLERLPRAEIVLKRSDRLDAQGVEDRPLLTGPWRVIRVNSDRFWLVPDVDGALEVTQLDSSEIASITYLQEELECKDNGGDFAPEECGRQDPERQRDGTTPKIDLRQPRLP